MVELRLHGDMYCTVKSILHLCSPAPSSSRRYERVTDNKGEGVAADQRTEDDCVAQYQSSTLRVLTHFVASQEDGPGQHTFLLGSDWQVEVTQLVKDSLMVVDPKIAELLEGHVLIGLNVGTTKLQVCVSVLANV